MTTPDYLGLIRKTRRTDFLATYIRAQGCALASELACYSDAERLQLAKRYNEQARSVEMCEDIGQARSLLKKWGYLGSENKILDVAAAV